MKKALTTAALIVLSIAAAISLSTPMKTKTPKPDKNGHILQALWASYDAATKADKPKTRLKILDDIKEQALAGRYGVDFYDAATAYVQVAKSRNWKLADSLETALEKEIKEFNEPIVTFQYRDRWKGAGSTTLAELARKNKEALAAGHTTVWYSGVSGMLSGALTDFVKDDYEYALWRALYKSSANKDAATALEEHLAGAYPNAALEEYYLISHNKYGYPALYAKQDYAKKYDGKAVALFAEADILSAEYDTLRKNKASSDEYKAFYDRLGTFEKKRASFKGDEKKIASVETSVEELRKKLKSRSVEVEIKEGKGYVYLRNTADQKVRLSYGEGKTVFEKTVKNPKNSFYVIDTVVVDFPVLDDGVYTFAALDGNRLEDLAGYERYTLALALRETSEGHQVYVTDSKTGKPLEKAGIVLLKNGSKIAEGEVTVNGFTNLPENIASKMKKGESYEIYATFRETDRLRRSDDIYIYNSSYYGYSRYEKGTWCNVYRDRGAYNPGDELSYKVVLFGGDKVRQLSVLPDKELTVTFRNSEGKDLATQKITTGEYGSASGKYSIPKDERGGMFSMRVTSGTSTLATEYFRVDEFVLPTFDLVFDTRNDLVLPGDKVTVSGRLISYSGHGLSDADVSYYVEHYGVHPVSEEVTVDEDGNFSFDFVTGGYGYYIATVRVTDTTGETREFHKGFYVPDYLRVEVEAHNASNASYEFVDGKGTPELNLIRRPDPNFDYRFMIAENDLDATISVKTESPLPAPLDVTYVILDEGGNQIGNGSASSGVRTKISLGDAPCGRYTIEITATAVSSAGKQYKTVRKVRVLKVLPEAKVLNTGVCGLFVSGPLEVAPGEEIAVRMGSTEGPVWAIATLYGENRKVLEERLVELSGEVGTEGSLLDLKFAYPENYPDAVRLVIFYFQNRRAFEFEREFFRKRSTLDLPLEFSSFEDRTLPRTKYTFSLKTSPGVEALAAVFDKSLDAIATNEWGGVRLSDFHVDSPWISSTAGREGSTYVGDVEFRANGAGRMLSKAVGAPVLEAEMAYAVEDAAVARDEEEDSGEPVTLRENFSTILAFEPHLVSDADGNISFTFSTSDKLSTYHVAVFAHDKNMRNGQLREDMMVTIPVKVAIVEPRTLYVGDRYDAAVTVSSISDKPIKGKLTLYVYPSSDYAGTKPVLTKSQSVSVPAKGTAQVTVPIDVPEPLDGTIGIRAEFKADKVSDGVFIPVPVLPGTQVLTETHSAVLLPGGDKDAVVKRLRGLFVNVPGTSADVREISIRDMVLEAIPDKVEPESNDVLALTEALYVRFVAASLGAEFEPVMSTSEILAKIADCRNADGGYGWFSGFRSSQIVTATVLERFALLRARGFEIPDVESAVRYLDNTRFSSELPYWCGWLSTTQYMYVRALYAEVAFDPHPTGDKTAIKESLKDFKDFVQDYLVPSKEDGRGLEGRILQKSRRLLTLRALAASPEGEALAKAWGIKGDTLKKLEGSIKADYESLVEYAIEHRDGGWYYPNAVMPLRGLLENEAYAHALLCRLMSDAPSIPGIDPAPESIARGIRIWLMLQKETQKWDAEPEFVDALDEILKDEDVLDTRVVVLSSTYKAPFKNIKAAGNGFTLKRLITVERDGSTETTDASTLDLKVGDKVTVRYEIWSQENRSFVRLTAPREGALVPEDQLSGHYGWRFRPISVGGWYSLSPQGYREVKAADTRYYFDTFPEETTVISESFFVTEAGRYSAPVPVVESLYAPHYRANSAFSGVLEIKSK